MMRIKPVYNINQTHAILWLSQRADWDTVLGDAAASALANVHIIGIEALTEMVDSVRNGRMSVQEFADRINSDLMQKLK